MDLKEKIGKCRDEIRDLKEALEQKESQLHDLQSQLREGSEKEEGKPGKLSNSDVSRYSRQLLLPEIGVQGQLSLIQAKVLLVGGGGLGCPAAQYLGAAGIGHIGVVDYDHVEISNLHRQVLHSEEKVGVMKGESIVEAIKSLNSSVHVQNFPLSLNSSNALEVLQDFDVILDCSDNVATRYLLNDACVILNKPLVSGSALRFEGQLTVYNYPPGKGTTYRCLYPNPPPPETVTNCSDGGVLGVIPGIIGCLQALEAIKIVIGGSLSEFVLAGKMILFDGFSGKFRTVSLRPRQTESSKIDKLIDYVQFCGSQPHDKELDLKLLSPDKRIKVDELSVMLKTTGDKMRLIDVRTEQEMDIGSIPESINLPMNKISDEKSVKDRLNLQGIEDLIVICRKGNDSQKATLKLSQMLPEIRVRDVEGGLTSWTKKIDPDFPIY